MPEPKHTPAPWTVAGSLGYALLVDPNVCVVYGDTTAGGAGRQIANAHLIAAAPHMLAALKAILAESDVLPESLFLKAAAAAAMAEGWN